LRNYRLSRTLSTPLKSGAILEMTLDDLLEKVPPAALERLPEDLLRRIFARLPQQSQDSLHARLFPAKKTGKDKKDQ